MKVRLMRQLPREGRLGPEEVEEISRCLDLVMPLRPDLAEECTAEVRKVEEGQGVPRIGQFE